MVEEALTMVVDLIRLGQTTMLCVCVCVCKNVPTVEYVNNGELLCDRCRHCTMFDVMEKQLLLSRYITLLISP